MENKEGEAGNRRLAFESNEPGVNGVKSGGGANTPEALTCEPPVVGNSSTPTSAQWSF